ncbi:MDR family MFS transporter [Aureibacillus halotolerans]|uniref:EmrB/QacA subfamily drug resistance transporter n=1 Tax=Aureibacillus halotolerans TaxID=1508390 RepID=A0A4R6U5S4_9BACI|nr:MDR family MFS transporter [Aureibacillus halotolerans]TDQ41106.1 EmrB/QacA subfamily drug resistance transporter [Aureibacillus halotolerans]
MVEKPASKAVVAGLLLGILMAAMDNTIVATATGRIVTDLGGFEQIAWVTAAYMVAVMAGMPIYGKLSDMYGRKRFFIFGLVLFLIGSALCGTSQSMNQLIIYRAIQGIGGGALMPIAFTIIFDIFPPEKRGKMTGLFGAVFGLSSVMGPLLGAIITDTIGWQWVFYVNVPIGAVSFFLIWRYYKETLEHKKQRIDWGGAITLVLAVVSLMFALELGADAGWSSPFIVFLFCSFVVLFVTFLFVEKKAQEPIISFWMFKNRLFATSQILAFIYGSTFVLLAVYIPIFVQAVYGGSATSAGFILTPMMIGSVVGSMVGGTLQTKVSFRNLMIVSVLFFIAGMALLATMTPETSRILLTVFMVLAGLGVGFSFSLLPSASINGLDARYRGSANSTNSFLRSFGMTLGITVFGTIQANVLQNKLSGNVAADPQALLQANMREQMPPEVLNTIVAAMSDSITSIFFWALIPIAIAAITIPFMGNEKVERSKPMTQKST